MPYIELKARSDRPRMIVWLEPIDLTIPVIDLTEDSDNSSVSLASTIVSGDSSVISTASSAASSQWGPLPGDSFLMELSDIENSDIPRWNLGGGGDSQ